MHDFSSKLCLRIQGFLPRFFAPWPLKSQYKANWFCPNLPTGTELGNITGYLESFPQNQLPKGVAIFELASAFSDFYPILYFFCNWPQSGPSFRFWNLETQSPLFPCPLNPLKMPPLGSFLSKNTWLAFSKSLFFCMGRQLKLSDTLLDPSLVDWTSQLELSLAKFDIHTGILRHLMGKMKKWSTRLKITGISCWYDRCLWWKFENPGSPGAHSAETSWTGPFYIVKQWK